MEPKIITKKIAKDELIKIVKENFGVMAKVDVNIKREILTIGGEWHSEGDALLVKNGSSSADIWGVNFYPWNPSADRIEYISLINIKPALGHKKMKITDKDIKEKIHGVIEKLLLSDDEKLDNV